MERDRRGLEREEKKLEMEIKKAAKQGNKQAMTVLAKQLIQMRKQKTRTYVVQSQIRGANSQSKVMGANVKLAETMGQTTKVMGQMNKIVDPQKVAKTMQEFEMANAKMEMTEETSKSSMNHKNQLLCQKLFREKNCQNPMIIFFLVYMLWWFCEKFSSFEQLYLTVLFIFQ